MPFNSPRDLGLSCMKDFCVKEKGERERERETNAVVTNFQLSKVLTLARLSPLFADLHSLIRQTVEVRGDQRIAAA